MIGIHELRNGLSLSIRIQVQEGRLEIFPRAIGLDGEKWWGGVHPCQPYLKVGRLARQLTSLQSNHSGH